MLASAMHRTQGSCQYAMCMLPTVLGHSALFWERDKKKTKQGNTPSTPNPQFVRSLVLYQHCFCAESLATDPLRIFSALQV